MKLSQAIGEFDFSRLAVRRPRQPKLEKAAIRVEQLADGLDVPEDLEAFDYEAAISDLSGGRATRRQVKRLAAGGLTLIAEEPQSNSLLDALFGAIDAMGRGLYKALLVGYLLGRNLDSPLMARVRGFLVSRKENLPTRWKERVNTYQLLSPNVGHHCCNLILRVNDFDPDRFARMSGIRGVKAAGGVAYRIFTSLSQALSEGHTDDRLERYLNFVNQDGEVRFESHIIDYANALLHPYIDTEPEEDKRSIIEQFMIDTFGDPRLSPAVWSNVPSGQIDVLKRWLAKASLELLFNVVSESNDTRQWAERSKFWRYYFDEGLITDAWVALGPAAAMVARRLVREEVISSASDFGVLSRGGAQSDHSVLIFKLGDFVITEWTHSGKVRIYEARNSHCPELYQHRYSAHAIRSDETSNVVVVHHQSWKERVAGFLQFELGVSPPRGVAPQRDTMRCSGCGDQLHFLWFSGGYAQKCSRCTLKAHYA